MHIDAVIAWVDGDDPVLRAKQDRYRPGTSAPAAARTRFAHSGEVFFALAALLRFAPWLHAIHIVTDGQRPDALDDLRDHFPDSSLRRIRIVDHAEIYAGHDDLLPVFNSRSFETMLHRIPGLAPRYIYLNDDFFLLRPCQPSDFFCDNQLIIRGAMRPVWPIALRRALRDQSGGRLFARTSEKEKQANAAALLGLRGKYLWHDHTPHPFLRDRMAEFWARHPDRMIANATPRWRQHDQFGIAALSYLLDRAAGNPTLRPTELLYLQPAGRHDEAAYLTRKLTQVDAQGLRFACIQSLDAATDATRTHVARWLGARILPGGLA